jgi:YbgC/YbaW family acyl-CoA thioester hydrolase
MTEFRYRRRVQFAETDQAGLVHFANIVRYMEEAEHALWRSLGLSIAPAGASIGFPRVAVSVDFRAPLGFEDEVDVHVRVDAIGTRSIRYAHTLRRGTTVVATGTMTAACVQRLPPPMRAVPIPAEIALRLRGGPPSSG